MKISHMREFIMLAETLSFTKAAELTFTTQPSLSKHLAELEEYYGTQLVERSRHGVRLTEAGQLVYQCYGDVLHQLDVLKNNVDEVISGQEGTLRLGVLYYAMTDYIYPIRKFFKSRYPKVTLSILSYQPPQLMAEMDAGRLDAGIIVTYPTTDIRRYRVQQFCRDSVVAAVSVQNPLADKEVLTAADFNGQAVILMEDQTDYSLHVQRVLNAAGVVPKQYVYAPQVDMSFYDIVQYRGSAIFPGHLRRQAIDGIVYREIQDPAFTVYMTLITRPDDRSPVLELFRRSLTEMYK